jgi:hypothetical protein
MDEDREDLDAYIQIHAEDQIAIVPANAAPR